MSFSNTLKTKFLNLFKGTKNKIVLVVFLFVWTLTACFVLTLSKGTLGKVGIGNENATKVIELTKNVTVEEELDVVENAEALVIKFANYRRVNSGNIYVRITGVDSSDVYIDEKINVNSLNNDDYHCFNFNEQLSIEKDRRLIVTISADSEKGSSAGVYYSPQKNLENSIFKYNDLLLNKDLGLKFMVFDEAMASFNLMIVLFSFIGITVVIFMLWARVKKEYVFVSLALIMGLVFSIIITPMAIPDEQTHYSNALELSNIVLGEKNYQEIDFDYFNLSHFSGHQNVRLGYVRFLRDINIVKETKQETIALETNIKDMYFGYYIPQTIGVTLSRIFNQNMLRTFYLGRITNLLFYCVCVFIALKKTPILKTLFGLISCLPICIQQAASFSYDGFINGLSLVLLAVIFKWLFKDEKINLKEFIFAFIVVLILTPAKYIYSLFTILFIFVPVDKFKNKKHKIITCLLLMSPGLLSVFYQIWIRLSGFILSLFQVSAAEIITTTKAVVDETSKPWNINYIIDYPMETILIIIRSVRYWIKTWFFESLGKALAGQSMLLPNYIMYPLLGLVLSSSFVKEEKRPSILFKIFSLLISMAIGLLAVVSMLTGWTARGATLIEGVQGRYFCPILPYFFQVFNNSKIGLPKKYDEYLIYLFIVLYFPIIIYILSFTFAN